MLTELTGWSELAEMTGLIQVTKLTELTELTDTIELTAMTVVKGEERNEWTEEAGLTELFKAVEVNDLD